MPLTSIRVKCFNLHHSIISGQPPLFLMDYQDNKASFLFKKRALVGLEQIGDKLKISWEGDASENEVKEEVMKRFRLGDDMKVIYKSIIKDKFMLNAVTELYGLRLTLTDPWETLVCFICSINNNLKNIRSMIQNINSFFGERIQIEGKSYFSFPTPHVLAKASVDELKKCKLGFRASYLTNAAKACSERIDLNHIAEMSYLEGKMELMRIKGIGEKIADCVMLFAYGRLESFPVDVWIRRTMQAVYFKTRKISDREITEFAHNYWKEYAGYAQQYVYWHGRNKSAIF